MELINPFLHLINKNTLCELGILLKNNTILSVDWKANNKNISSYAKYGTLKS